MDSDGQTPLCYAVNQIDLETVKLLLINKANVNVCDREGTTLLHHTALPFFLSGIVEMDANVVEMAKLLLERGVDINSKRNNGLTALHIAAVSNCFYLVKFLLEHKADVNAKGMGDMTALHLAAGNGNEIVTELLLQNGASVAEKDVDGMTALARVCADSFRRKTEAIFKILLKYNSDIDDGDSDGNTPLILAAENGNEEVFRILLSNGANVNAKNKRGYTAIFATTMKGKISNLKLLLEYEADPNSRCKEGMTSLYIAAEEGYEAAAEVLLENGADINVTDNKGKTPLDHSTERNEVEVSNILKEHIMKLKVADLFVSEQNLHFLDSDSKINESKFEEEINRMKRKISNTDVSFYDILSNRKNILVGLDDEEESVFQVIKSDDYKTEYPSYAYLLSRPITKIRKAIKRIELLRAIHTFFGSYSNHFMKLPYECREEIFTYLSDKDLKCFEDFQLAN